MSFVDYRTAVEVVLLAVWVEVAIRVMPFSRLLDRMKRVSGTPAASAAIEYSRLLRFVAVAYDVLPLPATCLRQSLVLHALLARRGVPSRLCLGVKRNGTALAAHAWIECDGMTRDAAAATFSELTAAAEELPHVLDKELRLLQRGEVASTRHVGELCKLYCASIHFVGTMANISRGKRAQANGTSTRPGTPASSRFS